MVLNRRIIIKALIVSACMSVSDSLVAQDDTRAPSDGERWIVVEPFSGPTGSRVRQSVISAIESKTDLHVLSYEKVRSAARKLDISLEVDKDYQAIARELQITAFVSGETYRRGRQWGATIRVRNGADGKILDQASWSARTTSQRDKAIKRSFWKRFGESIEGASPPSKRRKGADSRTKTRQVEEVEDEQPSTTTRKKPKSDTDTADDEKPAKDHKASAEDEKPWDVDKPKSTGDEEKPKETEAAAAPASDEPGRLVLDAFVGLHLFSRTYTYEGATAGDIPPYKLALGPAAYGSVDVYPAVPFTRGIVTRIGLTASYEHGFGIKSGYQGVEYPTSYSGLAIGIKARYPIGPVEIGAVAAYAMQSFEIGSHPQATKPSVPSVDYKFLRLGLFSRIDVTREVSVLLQGAYLPVLSSGELGSAAYFPRVSSNGFEGQVGLALRLGLGFEARAYFYLRRFSHELNSVTGDARMASGASDQYLGTLLGIGYRWSLGPVVSVF